jgi:hypothetical protein
VVSQFVESVTRSDAHMVGGTPEDRSEAISPQRQSSVVGEDQPIRTGAADLKVECQSIGPDPILSVPTSTFRPVTCPECEHPWIYHNDHGCFAAPDCECVGSGDSRLGKTAGAHNWRILDPCSGDY